VVRSWLIVVRSWLIVVQSGSKSGSIVVDCCSKWFEKWLIVVDFLYKVVQSGSIVVQLWFD
jgi:hypothetical protein